MTAGIVKAHEETQSETFHGSMASPLSDSVNPTRLILFNPHCQNSLCFVLPGEHPSWHSVSNSAFKTFHRTGKSSASISVVFFVSGVFKKWRSTADCYYGLICLNVLFVFIYNLYVPRTLFKTVLRPSKLPFTFHSQPLDWSPPYLINWRYTQCRLHEGRHFHHKLVQRNSPECREFDTQNVLGENP